MPRESATAGWRAGHGGAVGAVPAVPPAQSGLFPPSWPHHHFGQTALLLAPKLTGMYGGTSPTRKIIPLGPYRRPMPRVLGGSGGGFLWARYPCTANVGCQLENRQPTRLRQRRTLRPTLTEGTNRPISDFRFTLATDRILCKKGI